jgi:glucose-6-phosphate dehydrogenase assembly protein OpcA
VGTLTQHGQPDRRVALRRREIRDCLTEELRRLDPDEVYEATLHGLAQIVHGTEESTSDTATGSRS